MMSPLIRIKIIHTVIWVIFVSMIIYVDYSGITGHITFLTWIAISIIFIEGLILLWNHGVCPLTNKARAYSNSNQDNFDIYLPNWLAKHNKLIFTSLFIIGLLLILHKYIELI